MRKRFMFQVFNYKTAKPVGFVVIYARSYAKAETKMYSMFFRLYGYKSFNDFLLTK